MIGHTTNVTDFLLCGKEPERIALRLVNRNHTYGDLQVAVREIAGHLSQWVAQKGERVVLVGDNSFFWAAAYLGTLRAGLVCVPLPPNISSPDLDYILQVTDARFAFLQGGFAGKNRAHFGRMGLMTDEQAASLLNTIAAQGYDGLRHDVPCPDAALPPVNPDDLAALMFTSGSTGRPRGVMVSHRNIIANTESIIQYLGLTEIDRMMAVLPFHYCFGTSLLHTHLKAGGSLVVDSRFMYPELILQRMLETECTGFAGVPSHFQILLRNSTLRTKTFPHLRHVQQAGGHLAPSFVTELIQALPGTQIFVMYGQTEATARLSYLPPNRLKEKLGSIGKGIPGVRLQVLDESGKPVRPGEVGEIVAEGENVTGGYWRVPQDSAEVFRNNMLYTGDLATVDEEGFIYVLDRAKDFIKCGGKRTSSRQLEERLLTFEGLLEAAVVGIPDEVMGEAVKAFVVPREYGRPGFKEDLMHHCKKHFPLQLIPKEIVVLRTLPKNSAGKVLKQDLKRLQRV